MKKHILFSVILLGFTFSTATARFKAIDSGFSLFTPIGVSINDGSDVISIKNFGVKLGNRWYISPGERFGAGISAHWLDAAFGYKRNTFVNTASIHLSVLQVGPIVSLGLSELIAFDIYYNIRPTLIAIFREYQYENYSSTDYSYYSNTSETSGFGLTHAVGASFRFHVFTIGGEFVFGNVNSDISNTDNYTYNYKISANTLRLLVGVKF